MLKLQLTKSLIMALSYHLGNKQGFNFQIKGNSIVQLKAKVDTQTEAQK